MQVTAESIAILASRWARRRFWSGECCKVKCFWTSQNKLISDSYGVDIDAVAGWLGSYGGEDSTSDISRGKFDNDTTSRGPAGDSYSRQEFGLGLSGLVGS